ncbi:membrane protein [Bacteroidia bacterium]|nr:membrane protein [Bacteroidia bacterium]
MKKIIGLFGCIVLILFVAVPANAQLRLGIKGGLNIANVKLNSDIVKPYNVTGFHIGPLVELISPIGLGLDGAILYSQKGMDIGDEIVMTDYLEVPVNLKWKLQLPVIERVFKAYAAAGPYAQIRLSDEKSTLNNIKDQIETKSFGVGVNLGIGVELFSVLQVGFNYGIGLTDDYSINKIKDVMDIKAKEKNMAITAVLLF